MGCGRFLEAVLDQLISEFVDAGVPFGCEPLVATVVVDELEEVDETEEEELLRCSVFRGAANMPLTSSGFIEFRLWPPLTFHPGRLSCWKLGGLATAVMGKSSFDSGKDRRTLQVVRRTIR